MPGVARVGDSVATGKITDGASDVFVDGVPIAVVGSHVSPHGTHTGTITITQGSSTIFADGKAVARMGDPASCGDTISSSSEDVIGS